ncbi:hypothetical protein EPUL_000193, partial [Erysiphe pulchra]
MKGRRAFRYPTEDSDENSTLQSEGYLDEEVSITSLLSTAYLLVSLPPGQTNIAFIDHLSQLSTQKPKPNQYISLLPSQGPMKQFLPYLNIGLCVTLVLLGGVIEKRAGSLWFGLCFIPIINYGAVLITACFMNSIDPQHEL